MLRHPRSRSSLNSNINVTPMADVMLVLLIIFMITTPMLQDSVTVKLPKSTYPEKPDTKEPFTLSLTREGYMYLGRIPVTEQKMEQALSEYFANRSDKSLFIRADQAVDYGKVVHIVNECRKLGVRRVALMTEKETH